MSHLFTVILRDNGIDRTYPCANRPDATVLFDALMRLGRRVEMWSGLDEIAVYNP